MDPLALIRGGKPLHRWLTRCAALALLFAGSASAAPDAAAAAASVATPGGLGNAACLSCHDGTKEALKGPDGAGGTRELRGVEPGSFAKSVHSDMECIACHLEINDSATPHKKAPGAKRPDCVECHLKLDQAASQEKTAGERHRMRHVVNNIENYRTSFHARPNQDNPNRANASCNDCHDVHEFNVPPRGSQQRTEWHLGIAGLCGQCHEDQLRTWKKSTHGREILQKRNLQSADCADCHTAHNVANTSTDATKLAITSNCGNCHESAYASYRATYHGQVNKLGFAYTAKCFNCHGSHDVEPSKNPKSMVHPDNRLETCKECHNGKKGVPVATAGFASFSPHGNSHDFAAYPEIWIVSKFMIGLLIFVFAFFWLHSGLWFYREWQERKLRRTTAHVRTAGLDLPVGKHIRRFGWGWRLGHLGLALSVMGLVLTGSVALFSHSAWAPAVAKLLGGPKVLALIHRVAAAVFIGIFVVHFFYILQKLLRDKTFRWFGPDSLVPNWKDLADIIGMFKWFFGKGPKPLFERWTYFEKFDYWAVFWGVAVIGLSGLMLAFPHVTANYLPGWVFNVATIVHGEEAFLAAVFLFTVHFFNNHFRPNKLPPPDVVMFTGTQSLEEFRHEHPAQYQRLLDSGELQSRLVEAPSRPLHVGSVILGLTLLAIGLALLLLVGTGFFS